MSAVGAFIGSIAVFIFLLALTQAEQRRERRFFAASARGWLDQKIEAVGDWLFATWDHFVKYIVQLNWYYSIHSVLKGILHVIQRVYFYFENTFERNRTRAKKLRAERRELQTMSHLQQMAEHKQDTALTPAQKRKLREKKLEERH